MSVSGGGEPRVEAGQSVADGEFARRSRKPKAAETRCERTREASKHVRARANIHGQVKLLEQSSKLKLKYS